MAGAPSPLPKYIFKILPHASLDARYAFPVPIPASHEFFVSELDAKDGFIHLSTPVQLSRTLNRLFGDQRAVTLLRMELARLAGWKVIKWEAAGHGDVFPHLYATLEGENVDAFKEVVREEGESWDGALERVRKEGWLG